MYEITFSHITLFNEFKKKRRIYSDGMYDFTFEGRYLIYHCHNYGDLVYIAFDTYTGLSSEITRRNNSRLLVSSEYPDFVKLILKSIEYTGDRRHLSYIPCDVKEYIKPKDEIETIFKTIMPEYGFKVRDEQIGLSKAMYEAMTEKRVGLCEAEVGTGKTLAYLVAAVIARKNLPKHKAKHPITISTSSIELQKSIIERDIPLLSQILQENGYISRQLRAVLRKGKEHYMCFGRYRNYIENLSKHSKKYKKLLGYFRDNKFEEEGFDLDKSELSPSIKDKICVKGSCNNCRFSKKCNYYKFKTSTTCDSNLDIQVTNHNLYLASRKREGEGILRNSSIVVIDEAHKLKDAALDVFGTKISSSELKSFASLVKATVVEHDLSEKYIEAIQKLRKTNHSLMGSLEKYARDTDEEDDKKTLIELAIGEKEKLKLILENLRILEKIRRYMPFEYMNWCSRLIEKIEVFEKPSNLNVWVEKDDSGNVELCSSNKNIGNIMYKYLWDKEVTHVLTSGTMSDGVDFDFFKTENGISQLPGYSVVEKRTPSPFNYQEHTRLYIPNDMPLPEYDDRYYSAIADKVTKLVKATKGHTAVLFTSYKALSAVYELTKDKLLEYEIFQMTKGNDNVISDFKKSKNGVIFASGAMWEGVDCAGDCLSSVIITRLPFPLRTANMEYKKNECANIGEFVNKYAIPEMIIKLRQGVGRLIRKETDTGVVSILDSRASNGYYADKVLGVLEKYPLINTIEEVESFIRKVKPDDYFANYSCQKEHG